jgi:hypothetical protein
VRSRLPDYYYTAYHSQEELEAELTDLAASFPHLASLYSIGTSTAANQLLAIR